jgi:hypothetical protein
MEIKLYFKIHQTYSLFKSSSIQHGYTFSYMGSKEIKKYDRYKRVILFSQQLTKKKIYSVDLSKTHTMNF